MRNIKLTLISVTLSLAVSLGFSTATVYATMTLSNDWTLTWSDEFEGDKIDTSNWTYDIDGHGWGNNELQYYTDRSENARVEDGNLIIEARKESYKDSEYTSARLKTEGLQNFAYGKIEARIKLPEGQGLWSAFWMLGSNMAAVEWPDCGELDIMEHINTDENIWGTIHWKSDSMQSYGGKMQVDVTEYHNYSIEWTPNYIRWLVDDNKFAEYDITNGINGTTPYHKPFFIVLNLAVGGNWPKNPDSSTEFPVKMYVDYVRVYNKSSSETKARNAWFQNKFNGSWYYLNGNGNPFIGWLYTKDYWYYMDSTGVMKTGWLKNNENWYYLNYSGAMEKGWINDSGNWYYLNETGIMLKDTTINEYTLNSNGAWIQ